MTEKTEYTQDYTPSPAAVDAGMSVDLTGKVAVVTGGTRGIGRGITQAFLDAGAHVVICGRNEPDEPIKGPGGQAVFIAADIRDPEAAKIVVDQAVSEFGRLDIVVNNAGGSPMADVATCSPRFVASIVNLNLLAPFYIAQPSNAIMQTQETGGVIINIGSVSASHPAPGTAPYSAAKAGLTMFTKALALEWAPKVRVVQVSAGLVETEQVEMHYGDEAGQAAVAATIPAKRMATPADIANACLLMCSPLAQYVNGADLLVHGGGELPARILAAGGHN